MFFSHNEEFVACLAKVAANSESEDIISSTIVTLAAIVNDEKYVRVLAKSKRYRSE